MLSPQTPVIKPYTTSHHLSLPGLWQSQRIEGLFRYRILAYCISDNSVSVSVSYQKINLIFGAGPCTATKSFLLPLKFSSVGYRGTLSIPNHATFRETNILLLGKIAGGRNY